MSNPQGDIPPADVRVAANNLRAIRKQQKLSQTALAIIAEVGQPTIVSIEKYNWVPGYKVRTKLALALDVSASTIWPHLAQEQ